VIIVLYTSLNIYPNLYEEFLGLNRGTSVVLSNFVHIFHPVATYTTATNDLVHWIKLELMERLICCAESVTATLKIIIIMYSCDTGNGLIDTNCCMKGEF